MAQNLPYTLSDLQDRINVLVNNDTDTPSASDDDDYTLITTLINQAIGNWESDADSTLWDELWSTYTHGTLVTASTSTYALSTLTDMHFPGGAVQLTLNGSTTYIPVISPEEYQTYQGSAQVVYFTGNIGAGWTLNLGWTPATGDGTVGATIKVLYYKTATKLSSSTDKPEMSDPNYIIYWVAAQKSLLESKRNQYQVYDSMAQDSIEKMRVMNDIKPYYNANNVPDIDAISHGAIVGE